LSHPSVEDNIFRVKHVIIFMNQEYYISNPPTKKKQPTCFELELNMNKRSSSNFYKLNNTLVVVLVLRGHGLVPWDRLGGSFVIPVVGGDDCKTLSQFVDA
jgi:hypothetical protein